MATRVAGGRRRRKPQQQRAQATVEAIQQAVARILKREGAGAVTTNRIAEVAGVSIGSVYQYFPDKSAIFAALHLRHIEEIDRLMESILVEHAASPLETLVRALVEGMVEAHTGDPELYALMMTEVPQRAEGTKPFAVRMHGAFRLALASRMKKKTHELEKTAFVMANMVDALAHGAVLRRPAAVSLIEAKNEAVRAVMSYLSL